MHPWRGGQPPRCATGERHDVEVAFERAVECAGAIHQPARLVHAGQRVYLPVTCRQLAYEVALAVVEIEAPEAGALGTPEKTSRKLAGCLLQGAEEIVEVDPD